MLLGFPKDLDIARLWLKKKKKRKEKKAGGSKNRHTNKDEVMETPLFI